MMKLPALAFFCLFTIVSSAQQKIHPVPGLVYIDLLKSVQTKYMSVVELTLDKPVRLYNGRGGFN